MQRGRITDIMKSIVNPCSIDSYIGCCVKHLADSVKFQVHRVIFPFLRIFFTFYREQSLSHFQLYKS